MKTSSQLYAMAARLSVLTISSWGAMLGLFAEYSLTARIDGTFSLPLTLLNSCVLLGAALGYADVLWHDIGGRLIWPSFDPLRRHKLCVSLYGFFGAVWLVKSFVSLGVPDVHDASTMALFSFGIALVCGLVSVAIALEPRA